MLSDCTQTGRSLDVCEFRDPTTCLNVVIGTFACLYLY